MDIEDVLTKLGGTLLFLFLVAYVISELVPLIPPGPFSKVWTTTVGLLIVALLLAVPTGAMYLLGMFDDSGGR